MRRLTLRMMAAAIVSLLLGCGWGNQLHPFPIERVDVSSEATQGVSDSCCTSISDDGLLVAFESRASNLVPGDTNGRPDIFVRDRDTQVTERISVAGNGEEGNGGSFEPSISSDGRFVAFVSIATNLVPGDSNGRMDVFVYDRETRKTQRVSVADNGDQGNSGSLSPAISEDGRFVAFGSAASNLVPGDANGVWDIFVHDRRTRVTIRVSVGGDSSQGNDHSMLPSVNADGRFIAFGSAASNLVPGDTNGVWDIFVHDREKRTTQRVSVASDGSQGNEESRFAAITGDGRVVTFWSLASNLVFDDLPRTADVFVHQRKTGKTERVSVAGNGESGDDSCLESSINGDGRFVVFSSFASNLVPDDTNGEWDIFVLDRENGEVRRVSVTADGVQANGGSRSPVISGDGRVVSFDSCARQLVPGDTNGVWDSLVAINPFFETRAAIPSALPAPGSPSNPNANPNAKKGEGCFVDLGPVETMGG